MFKVHGEYFLILTQSQSSFQINVSSLIIKVYTFFTVTEHLEKSSCKCWLLACTVSKVLAYIPGKYNNTYDTTARTVKSSNSVMT